MNSAATKNWVWLRVYFWEVMTLVPEKLYIRGYGILLDDYLVGFSPFRVLNFYETFKNILQNLLFRRLVLKKWFFLKWSVFSGLVSSHGCATIYEGFHSRKFILTKNWHSQYLRIILLFSKTRQHVFVPGDFKTEVVCTMVTGYE